MRFNLSDKDYNLNELSYQTQVFSVYNNRYPLYIVMSERTKQFIERHATCSIGTDVHFEHGRGYIGEFVGIPIACYEGLAFGVVDIV